MMYQMFYHVFAPVRESGFYLDAPLLRGKYVTPIEFFQLYFTDDMINDIRLHTNAYAWANITQKQYYADQQGAWKDVTPNELKSLALIIYFGLVKVNHFHDYWSTKRLYHGLWTQNMLTCDRFKAIMAILHIVDFSKGSKDDKLKKVQHFIDHVCQRCKELYQPSANVAIDEGMVNSKHRSGMRQHMPLKPAKFGPLD